MEADWQGGCGDCTGPLSNCSAPVEDQGVERPVFIVQRFKVKSRDLKDG